MADLGEAVLKLTVDDSELTTRLGELRREIESLGSAGTRRTSRASTRATTRSGGAAAPGDVDRLAQLARELNLNTNWGKALRVLGEVDADLALIGASQQFNLNAGWTAALQQFQEINSDLALISGGDALNLNTSWTAALQQLREIDADLKVISAGESLNLNTSWTTALQQLKEIDADLRLVSAGESLKLNTSWTTALQQLKEIDADLKLVSSAEALNINSSWTQALAQLREIDADLRLVASGESLNLNSSWSVALEQLQEVDADLRAIRASDSLNIRTSWTTALQQLEEVDNDLRLIQGGRDLNIATSWRQFLTQLSEVKADIDSAARQQVNAQTKATIRGRIEEARRNPSGFGAASRDNFGVSPQTKSEQLEADLARVREQRIREEKLRLAGAARLKKFDAAEERSIRESIKRRNKRNLEAVGNALIGGAFPALFGQGLGASIGGAAGGGLGGLLGGNFGFGLSLVGTALGQRFDDINKALESPIENFEQLKTSGALSSKSLEKYAEGLIATGRTAEAAALIQQDLSNSFGADSLSAFADVRNASDELNRSFGQAAATVGAFIAGPLASFLRQIASAGNNFSTATRFEDLTGRLDPDQYRQVRDVTDRATRDAQRQRGGSAFLPPSEGDVAAGRRAGIAEAERLLGIKQQELELEQAIAAARLQTTKELSNSFRLISAQVQGNRSAQLDARANSVIDERNKALRVLAAQNVTAENDPRVIEANQTAARELFRIEEERLQLQKEIARTIEQEAIKRQQIAQQIAAATARRDAALAAADAGANPGNSTLAARAGQLEGASFLAQNRLRVEQAITRERELQAQLAQESDPTRRSQLAEQLRTAADEIRLAGQDAGAALAERAASAAQSLRGAQDSLRSTLQGNFRLLPRDQRRSLLQQAQADVARGRNTGIIRDTFRTASRRRLFATADFVRNVEQQRAQVAQQQALVEALNANTNAERNIRINVTMNADGSFNVNQTEQQAALL